MSISAGKSGITPANLAFLTIYNPSLSQNDDTIEDQIVYYYSKSEAQKTHRRPSQSLDEDDREYKNEKLRQIGLAQGMVEFAKTFSDGQAVDSIETEKSRILLRQVEAGWWLLASVDLTRISSPPDPQANPATLHHKTESNTEYSSREVSPSSLLLEQVVQAHQIFLLHHAQTLQELFLRLPRTKFCAILKRFWDDFIRSWDVLLHGNPAIDIFDGVKLAAGGELGIGVGEEEWGSGEREVLEGFIGRTDGLVDLIVSRFGEMTSTTESALPDDEWHIGRDPRPSDGVIFSGIGAIGRPSVKRISNWVVSLFKHGQDAYGVRENPVAVNRRQRKKTESVKVKANSIQAVTEKEQRPSPIASSGTTTAHSGDFGIPAPIVGAPTKAHLQQLKNSRESPAQIAAKTEQTQPAAAKEDYAFGSDTLIKYMTFGLYGSKSATPSTDVSGGPSKAVGKDGKKEKGESRPFRPRARSSDPSTAQDVSPGYFMVGLQGDLDDEDVLDSATEREDTLRMETMSSRIVLRTLVVERTGKGDTGAMKSPSTKSGSSLGMLHDRLRVIVYVKRPFIFTFLFDLHTDSLAIPSFYRSLHHQLGPLQQPLLSSTSPTKVSERLSEALAPRSTVTTRSSQPINDLVYDPYNLTVHTTIPNIPEPGSSPGIPTAGQAAWTRVEALSVHSQILNTYISTRRRASELERTCKTNRGWWVVWMRIPHVAASQQLNQMVYREAFLIRKASDYVPAAKVLGGSWGKRAGASSGWGPGKLAEGIGIDARQYIEGLVSLNR